MEKSRKKQGFSEDYRQETEPQEKTVRKQLVHNLCKKCREKMNNFAAVDN